MVDPWSVLFALVVIGAARVTDALAGRATGTDEERLARARRRAARRRARELPRAIARKLLRSRST